MNHLPPVVRRNILANVAKFYGVRARRSIASEDNFWTGKCAALLAAVKLPQNQAAIIFKLARTQGQTKHFQDLCLNIH